MGALRHILHLNASETNLITLGGGDQLAETF